MEKKLKTCLYLDDVRVPTQQLPGYEPWNVVKNYNEFVDYITKHGVPDFISFDHDLAEEHMDDYYKQLIENGFQHPNYGQFKEKTGLDCAKFVAEYCQKMNVKLNYCAVHSHNPVGATNIQSFLNGFKKHMGWDADCYLGKQLFKIIE